MAGTTHALGFGLAAMLAAASPASATDYIYGEYDGTCGPNLGCSLSIDAIKTGKTYKVTFETYVPKTYPQPPLCRVSGIATLHNGKVLVGEFGPGKPFEILKAKNSDMILGKTDNRPCGETIKMNGVFQMVGD